MHKPAISYDTSNTIFNDKTMTDSFRNSGKAMDDANNGSIIELDS